MHDHSCCEKEKYPDESHGDKRAGEKTRELQKPRQSPTRKIPTQARDDLARGWVDLRRQFLFPRQSGPLVGTQQGEQSGREGCSTYKEQSCFSSALRARSSGPRFKVSFRATTILWGGWSHAWTLPRRTTTVQPAPGRRGRGPGEPNQGGGRRARLRYIPAATSVRPQATTSQHASPTRGERRSDISRITYVPSPAATKRAPTMASATPSDLRDIP